MRVNGRAADDKRETREFKAEAIRLWLRSPVSMAGTVLLHLAAVWVLWRNLSHIKLILWAMAGIGWCGVRLAVWLYYRRRSWSVDETLRWGWIFTLLLGGTALTVAGITPYAFTQPDVEDRIFLVMSISGFAAGAMGVYGIHYPAVLIVLVPVLGTLSASFFLQNSTNTNVLGSVTLIYLVLLLISARTTSQWVWSIFDLRTRNDRLTAELIVAKDAAEEANEAKSIIMANMSHELRTPLNAIIGFAEMIEKQVLGPLGSPKYIDYAHDVHMSGIHLLSLINTILDLAKSRASRLELDVAPVDMAGLLNECYSVMRLQAENARLNFVLDIPAQPLPAEADDTRMRQVIYNLLSNAIKFTDAGGTITLRGRPAVAGGIEIEVTDTGIGMSQDDVETALQPFMQVKRTNRRASEGTGLGLPFAKTIVELHGGRLDIESTPGSGTGIRVLLPPVKIRQAA